jgi:hypothetical protein
MDFVEAQALIVELAVNRGIAYLLLQLCLPARALPHLRQTEACSTLSAKLESLLCMPLS